MGWTGLLHPSTLIFQSLKIYIRTYVQTAKINSISHISCTIPLYVHPHYVNVEYFLKSCTALIIHGSVVEQWSRNREILGSKRRQSTSAISVRHLTSLPHPSGCFILNLNSCVGPMFAF